MLTFISLTEGQIINGLYPMLKKWSQQCGSSTELYKMMNQASTNVASVGLARHAHVSLTHTSYITFFASYSWNIMFFGGK